MGFQERIGNTNQEKLLLPSSTTDATTSYTGTLANYYIGIKSWKQFFRVMQLYVDMLQKAWATETFSFKHLNES